MLVEVGGREEGGKREGGRREGRKLLTGSRKNSFESLNLSNIDIEFS